MARQKRTKSTNPDASIVRALDWYKFVSDVESAQRDDEQDSLAFQEADGAWPEDVKQSRQALQPGSPGYPASLPGGVPIPARPVISIASLDEPFMLATAQEQGAHLGVQIHPLTDDATTATAEVYQGLYRCIERDSRASQVRSWGYQRTLWAGRGYWRVDKVPDEQSNHLSDQKLLLKRILDGSSVYLDPFAQEPDWSDGRRAMIVIAMPWSTYKEKWPKSKVASFDDTGLDQLATDYEGWVSGTGDETRTVRVAEDWRVEVTTRTKVLLDDDSSAFEDEIPEGRTARTGADAYSRPIEVRKVFWRTINCQEELESEQEWDGDLIPIIPDIGRELQPVRGKRRWIGMATNAKGAVRLTNYAASNAVEMAALEPKAPWQGVEGVFEGHEAEYMLSSVRNIGMLQHRAKDLEGNTAPAPQRVQVDVSRLGPSMQLLSMGQEFIQTATSFHPPSLGKQTPAFRSGEAIKALQGQSVESNSPYLDNHANIGTMYEARVVIGLIPKVYDRPGRIARILDPEGKTQLVMLNHPYEPHALTKRPTKMAYDTDQEKAQTDRLVADPNHPAKYYDLSVGMYGVEVTIGKSYKDKRDEGTSEMGTILQADPQMMQIIGPEYFQERGEPWATKVAALLKRNRDHVMPWLSDQPQQDLTGQLAAAHQQMQAMSQKLQEQEFTIKAKQVEHQAKVELEKVRVNAENERALALQAMKDATTIAAARISAAKASLDQQAEAEEERIALHESQAHEAAQNALDRAHEALMASGDHQATLQQGEQQAGADASQSAQDHGQALEQQQQAADLAPEPQSSVDNGSGAGAE